MDKCVQQGSIEITYADRQGQQTTEPQAFHKLVYFYDKNKRLVQSSLHVRFSLQDQW